MKKAPDANTPGAFLFKLLEALMPLTTRNSLLNRLLVFEFIGKIVGCVSSLFEEV